MVTARIRVAMLLWLLAPAASAVGELIPVYAPEIDFTSCSLDKIEPYFAAGKAVYQASGSCELLRIVDSVPQRVDSIKWRSVASFRNATGETEETITLLRRTRPDLPNYAETARLGHRFNCRKDPWLVATPKLCTLEFAGGGGNEQHRSMANPLYQQTGEETVPQTSRITAEQRQFLQAKFKTFRDVASGTRQPVAQAPVSVARADRNPAASARQPVSPGVLAAVAIGQPPRPGLPTGCKAGFVHREATPIDAVCVPPESQARVRLENAAAPSRWNPQGANGPRSCIAGFAWREAVPGDVVCVTPEVREVVRQENALAGQRAAPR